MACAGCAVRADLLDPSPRAVLSLGMAALSESEELAKLVGDYYHDPLGFVQHCWPWGTGPLYGEDGPDANQVEFLRSLEMEVRQRNFQPPTPCMPVLMAESSGHGTGKSAQGAWLAWWVFLTRPYSIGTVTAGNYTQLDERTWAAILQWGKTCLIPVERWADLQAHGVYSREDPDNWKFIAQSCKEENAQSFAGQHARRSTSWYLFDEASIVPDGVWKTALEGGLTDGEPMFFAWGQCIANSGKFYEVCFGRERARWNVRVVDARTSRFANLENIKRRAEDYGEDSDTFRVRVMGQAPSASELQYIDRARVRAAQQRLVVSSLVDPLIAGFDVSGGGRAWNVIRFRRGLNFNERPAIRIPGEREGNPFLPISHLRVLQNISSP